ncbi:MAG: hypothetical protein AAB373_03510 [Patescibacteria group bacterium]
MLTEENFDEFIDQINTTYYYFQLWINLNNEYVPVQDKFSSYEIPKLMKFTLHSLQQTWILGIARLLDGGEYNGNRRLSVEFILTESGDIELMKYYVDYMQQDHMKKFKYSNRDLRDEKIAHMTPGIIKIKKQKAGIEEFFDLIEHIIQKLQKNHPSNKKIGYDISVIEAKQQASLFIKKIV